MQCMYIVGDFFFLHFLLMNNMFMDHLSCTKPSRPLKNPLKSHFASVFC